MDGLHWAEVAGWASILSSWVLFAVGVATGPPGWVGYAIGTATVLTTFVGMTSTAYGTYERLSYSRSAATYQTNAMEHLHVEMWVKENHYNSWEWVKGH